MTVSKEDSTAFSDAIQARDAEAVRNLIQQFPELANHPDWVPPPLHCAVLWNQPEIAEVLLDSGADIEMLDPDRQTTPLRYAVMYCKTELIPLLLKRGANSGAIVEDGSSALELAREAAGGAYEEYEDLPRPADYQKVVDVLLQNGITE